MERNSKIIICEKVECEDYLDTVSTSSESNFLLERYFSDSSSAENVAYPDTVIDECTIGYKRKKDQEDLEPNKKRKDNCEALPNDEQMQVSAEEQNPSMNTSKESLPEVGHIIYNPKQMDQSEDSEIINANNYVFESMSADNNPFVSETTYLSAGVLCFEKTNSSARGNPLAYKTIVVKGLPQKITEGIVKEIFQRCGSIETIKMEGSESCYVTFSEVTSAEFALRFSGYRLKIDKRNEAPYSGILFIDYARSEFDYSCSVHSQGADNSILSSFFSSRPNQDNSIEQMESFVAHYTSDAASFICQKLKSAETFTEAVKTVIMWLDQEECSAENASSFISMLQCIHNYVMKLHHSKSEHLKKLNDSKKAMIKHLEEILCSLRKVEIIYLTVSLEKFSNYFTLGETKNIKIWEEYARKVKLDIRQNIRELKIKKKEARGNENDKFMKQMKDDMQKLKNDQSKLRHQLQNLKCNIATTKKNIKNDFENFDKKFAAMQKDLRKYQRRISKLKEQSCIMEFEKRELYSQIFLDDFDWEFVASPTGRSLTRSQFIISVSWFLCNNPGASADSIFSFLHQFDANISCRVVADLLQRFPTIFREDVAVIGNNLSRKWYFESDMIRTLLS